MALSKITLGGFPMRVNPNEVRWNFRMKTFDGKALGGKVIQVTGVKLDDISVRGQYAPDRSLGDREAWQQQLRFREWVDQQTEAVVDRTVPIRFTYPPRGWDFRVFIKKFSGVNLTNEEIGQTWEISLFPFDAGAARVVDGIKDLYIKRLMDGVGWKQSDYNGPTQGEVDDMLAPFGGSVEDWMESEIETAVYGTSSATSSGVPGVQP